MNQFWIFLIVVGISVASSIIGKLKEQAEINRAREAARKRREEEERTGRSSGQSQTQTQTQRQGQPSVRSQPQYQSSTQSSQQTAGAGTASSREQRMRDIAQRRQAELRELRERQARMRAQREQSGEESDSGTQVRGPAQRGQRTPDVVRPGTPRPAGKQAPRRRGTTGDGDTSARDAYLKRERERQREIAQSREIEMESQRQAREAARKREQAKAKGEDGFKSYVPLADIAGAAKKVKGKTKAEKKSAMSGSIRDMLTGGTPASRRERLQMIVALNEILEKPVSQRENRESF